MNEMGLSIKWTTHTFYFQLRVIMGTSKDKTFLYLLAYDSVIN